MLHTYIHGHYNPLVRIIDLVSYTTYVVCVNLFKVDSERHIFWETFHDNSLFTLRVFARNQLRKEKSPKKYFSYFVLMSGLSLFKWMPSVSWSFRIWDLNLTTLAAKCFSLHYFMELPLAKPKIQIQIDLIDWLTLYVKHIS